MGAQFSEPTTEAAYPPSHQRGIGSIPKRTSTLSVPTPINGTSKPSVLQSFQKRCFAVRNELVRFEGSEIIREYGLCCQLLAMKPVSKFYIYSITVVKSEWGHIGWGIIDSQYRDHEITAPYDPITPNIIYFQGWSGAVYGESEGVLRKEILGFGEGSKVSMEVSWDKEEEMEITWWVNRDFQVQYRTRRFAKKRVAWVPFIKLWTTGDVIRFQEQSK